MAKSVVGSRPLAPEQSGARESSLPVVAENSIPACRRCNNRSKRDGHKPRGLWLGSVRPKDWNMGPAGHESKREEPRLKGPRFYIWGAGRVFFPWGAPAHRTEARRGMSFAPGAGASEALIAPARLPVLPRYLNARMSSMARSTPTICQARLLSIGGTAPPLATGCAGHPLHPSQTA